MLWLRTYEASTLWSERRISLSLSMSEDPGEGSGEEDGVEVGEPGIAMLIGRQLAWAGEHVSVASVML